MVFFMFKMDIILDNVHQGVFFRWIDAYIQVWNCKNEIQNGKTVRIAIFEV